MLQHDLGDRRRTSPSQSWNVCCGLPFVLYSSGAEGASRTIKPRPGFASFFLSDQSRSVSGVSLHSALTLAHPLTRAPRRVPGRSWPLVCWCSHSPLRLCRGEGRRAQSRGRAPPSDSQVELPGRWRRVEAGLSQRAGVAEQAPQRNDDARNRTPDRTSELVGELRGGGHGVPLCASLFRTGPWSLSMTVVIDVG